MQTNTRSNHPRATVSHPRNSESGFSLLEMVVAMVILTIGLLGVASAIGYSLMVSNRGRGVTNSKMLVVSILEQMETLRNTRELKFEEISNTQVTPEFTGFPYDPLVFRPVSTVPGRDGIFGTADDLWDSGTGTTDDMSKARPGVSRKIEIIDFPTNPYLKKVKVTLRYSTGDGKFRELVGISYLNDDVRGTYVH